VTGLAAGAAAFVEHFDTIKSAIFPSPPVETPVEVKTYDIRPLGGASSVQRTNSMGGDSGIVFDVEAVIYKTGTRAINGCSAELEQKDNNQIASDPFAPKTTIGSGPRQDVFHFRFFVLDDVYASKGQFRLVCEDGVVTRWKDVELWPRKEVLN
jgi:hypothetical protein